MTASPLAVAAGLGDVLQLFRTQPTLTRADVMAQTGLSRSTVNQRLDALLGAALVVPSGEGAPTGGRPASRFAFNSDRGVLLVADIGASGMRIALCNLRGEVRHEREQDIDVADGPSPVLTAVDSAFRALLASAGCDPADVHGIGIDVPGPVDFDSGQVVSPPIMSGWDRYDIPAWFTGRYDCPVLVDKDVNAMAVGEHRSVHPHVRQLLMIKAGTGIGAGMIIDGGVYRGADGAAGDIGHIQLSVVPDRLAGPGPLAGSGLAGSGLAGPGLAGPGLAGPGLAGPGLAGPGLAGPGLAGPGLAGPGLAGPGLAGPGLAGSGLAGSGFAGSGTRSAFGGEGEPVCRCGNTGCVEAYAGGWALVRDLTEAGRNVRTVSDAVALIRTGDVTAVRLARRAGRILGHAIADSVSLLNPSVVVVGGQLAEIEEQLFAGIREMVYRRSLPLATRKLTIVATTLGPRSGLVGMALLLADSIFAPPRVETLIARQ
ncbi:ROK family transcriptional regulator [Actinoplanes lutulentus]|nr:ROK family transcriptional regulator [Actinoplanes lutulentus]